MLNDHAVQRWASVNRLLTWLPSVLLTALVAEACWVAYALDRWPRPFLDDLADPVGVLLDSIAIGVFLAALPAVPAWLFSIYPVMLRDGRRTAVTSAFLFVGAFAVLIALAWLNPFRFPEWWLD